MKRLGADRLVDVQAEVVAAVLGFGDDRVHTLVREGVLPRPGRPGHYNLPACVQAYVRFIEAGRVGDRSAAAKLRELNAQARIKEAKAADLEQQYLDREATRTALLEVAERLAAVLDGAAGPIASAVQGACGGDRGVIQAVLLAEHRRVRQSMADGLEDICRRRRAMNAGG